MEIPQSPKSYEMLEEIPLSPMSYEEEIPLSPMSYEMSETCRAFSKLCISEPLAVKVAYERMVLGVEPDAILRTELKLLGKLKRGSLSVDEVEDFVCVWKHLIVPLNLNLNPPQQSNTTTYELYFLQKYMEGREQEPCSKEMLLEQREEQLRALSYEKRIVVKKDPQRLEMKGVIFIQDPCMTFWLEKDYVFSCVI